MNKRYVHLQWITYTIICYLDHSEHVSGRSDLFSFPGLRIISNCSHTGFHKSAPPSSFSFSVNRSRTCLGVPTLDAQQHLSRSASGEVGRGKCFGNGPKMNPGRTVKYAKGERGWKMCASIHQPVNNLHTILQRLVLSWLAILSGLITLALVSRSRLISSGWPWNRKGWTQSGKAWWCRQSTWQGLSLIRRLGNFRQRAQYFSTSLSISCPIYSTTSIIK